jgi:hypothetical protein
LAWIAVQDAKRLPPPQADIDAHAFSDGGTCSRQVPPSFRDAHTTPNPKNSKEH